MASCPLLMASVLPYAENTQWETLPGYFSYDKDITIYTSDQYMQYGTKVIAKSDENSWKTKTFRRSV